ncbi:MAG: ribonuclease Z [Candidatus Shikimatogenerans sp. Ttur]|uniref:Ribonuclease Z n=1 Tax=Candidatus Shikimatogenerans sp. Ttur TaxID=3158569 RepID=A0AAU7ZXS4_9FLAO
MKPKLIILGNNSSFPRKKYHPTSQILYISNIYFLIDCGEYTQIQIIKSKIKLLKINNILISHLHGDHYYGLISILSTFQLLNRKKTINIYCNKYLKKIINIQCKYSKIKFNYKINYIFLKKKYKKIFSNNKINIYNIPLKHNINNNGFLFKGKNEYKYSYAFCSDTIFYKKIIKYIKNVNLLYYDSTYINKYKILAKKNGHSTAKQAAKIALLANVKKLLLGHFSNIIKNLNLFKIEAKKIFFNTNISKILKTYYL